MKNVKVDDGTNVVTTMKRMNDATNVTQQLLVELMFQRRYLKYLLEDAEDDMDLDKMEIKNDIVIVEAQLERIEIAAYELHFMKKIEGSKRRFYNPF